MADELSPRWCPWARVASRRQADSFNRLVQDDVEQPPVLPLATRCVEDKCQMWTGSDCGLKHG
jgi:hypothetical protein